MATIKITNKDRFNALIDLVKAEGIAITKDGVTENTEDMVAWLGKQIDKADKKNSTEKAKKTSEQTKTDEMVYDELTTVGQAVKSIVSALNQIYAPEVPYSSSKITASLRRLVAEGKVVNTKGKGGESLYALTPTTEGEDTSTDEVEDTDTAESEE